MRTPYGYRLRQHEHPALEPDPLTAPVVRRVFDEYVGGYGLHVIAERLTADGILRPSAYDPRRNPHHRGSAWSKAAVRAIITNKRYAVGLVQAGTYQRAQEILSARGGTAGDRGCGAGTQRPDQRYMLRGLLRCGLCQRLMQGTWNNNAAYYRCRFPREYARANSIEHPANVYLREERLIKPLLSWVFRSLPARHHEWAGRQPPVVRDRLVARCQELRGLARSCWRDRARGAELFSEMGMMVVYEPGRNFVQVRTEVVRDAVVQDRIVL